MLKRVIAVVITGIIMGAGSLVRPSLVYAQLPQLRVNFQARDVTTGGDWLNVVNANPGDKVGFRAIMTNEGEGPARDVTVRTPLQSSNANRQYPTFHVLALNASIPDETITIVANNGSAALVYVPGSASITANGSTKFVSPDTASANITGQQIPVGDIAPGGTVTVVYNTTLASLPGQATPTIAPTNAAATASAVVKSTPKTGISDMVGMPTLGWLFVGITGFGMRRKAMQFLDRC